MYADKLVRPTMYVGTCYRLYSLYYFVKFTSGETKMSRQFSRFSEPGGKCRQSFGFVAYVFCCRPGVIGGKGREGKGREGTGGVLTDHVLGSIYTYIRVRITQHCY